MKTLGMRNLEKFLEKNCKAQTAQLFNDMGSAWYW